MTASPPFAFETFEQMLNDILEDTGHPLHEEAIAILGPVDPNLDPSEIDNRAFGRLSDLFADYSETEPGFRYPDPLGRRSLYTEQGEYRIENYDEDQESGEVVGAFRSLDGRYTPVTRHEWETIEEERLQEISDGNAQSMRVGETVEISFSNPDISTEGSEPDFSDFHPEVRPIVPVVVSTNPETMEQSLAPETAEEALRRIAGFTGDVSVRDDRRNEQEISGEGGRTVVRSGSEIEDRNNDILHRGTLETFAVTANARRHHQAYMGLRSQAGKLMIVALFWTRAIVPHAGSLSVNSTKFRIAGYYLEMSEGTVNSTIQNSSGHHSYNRIQIIHTATQDEQLSLRKQNYPCKILFLRESGSFRRRTLDRLIFEHLQPNSLAVQELWRRFYWEETNLWTS